MNYLYGILTAVGVFVGLGVAIRALRSILDFKFWKASSEAWRQRALDNGAEREELRAELGRLEKEYDEMSEKLRAFERGADMRDAVDRRMDLLGEIKQIAEQAEFEERFYEDDLEGI